MEQLISFLFFMVNFDPSNPFQSADLIVDVDPVRIPAKMNSDSGRT